MTKEEMLLLKSISQNIEDDVSDYDLNMFFNLANYHGVLPLCYEKISLAKGFAPSNFEKVKLKGFSIVFSQTKRSENFKEIYGIILENGIKPLVLKGIICRQLYGDLCDHRPSGDEDILIKKEEFFRVKDVMMKHGYIPQEEVTEKTLSGIQEITFKNPNGLNIEVHLNIIGTENKIRRIMNEYFKDVFEKTVIMEIDGQKYFTLDYTDHYIYLFFHMFKHFSTTGVGVRQILDMFKFAEAYDEKIDWNTVCDAIERINAQKLYGDIIEIGNKYMGFELKNPFGATLPERLLEDIFSAGSFGNGNMEQAGSKVKVMAAMDAGKKPGKLKMLFPSIESMREFYTVLYDHPYLLPVMWIVRIVRYILRRNKGETYDVLKSEKIADKKIELLQDYGII